MMRLVAGGQLELGEDIGSMLFYRAHRDDAGRPAWARWQSCSIMATGQPVPWHVLCLACGAGTAAGSGLTPGGFGIVEITLAATLASAGLTGSGALAAALTYRLVSVWLVLIAGWASCSPSPVAGNHRSPLKAGPGTAQHGLQRRRSPGAGPRTGPRRSGRQQPCRPSAAGRRAAGHRGRR
jgi:hypothetical protein